MSLKDMSIEERGFEVGNMLTGAALMAFAESEQDDTRGYLVMQKRLELHKFMLTLLPEGELKVFLSKFTVPLEADLKSRMQ